jgi:hypothetical protein
MDKRRGVMVFHIKNGVHFIIRAQSSNTFKEVEEKDLPKEIKVRLIKVRLENGG